VKEFQFGVVRVFLAIQRNSKIGIKEVKKLQKLINEVQNKTKQNRKKTKVYFMPESIEYAHRKCKKVNTHKK